MNTPCYIIGICGGSGSGKTTLAQKLLQDETLQPTVSLSLDNYYLNAEQFPDTIRGNYDHPESLDIALFLEHLHALRAGLAVKAPQYDFTIHRRMEQPLLIGPAKTAIVDGILLFSHPEVLALVDLKIYVDTAADLRLLRRLRRDVVERGRNARSVIDQYEKTVRPMHLRYVQPGKALADIVVDGERSIDEQLYSIQTVRPKSPNKKTIKPIKG